MGSGNIGVKYDDSGYGVKVKGDGGSMRQPTRLSTPGMCFYHQQIPAVYICTKCGRSLCHSCSQQYGSLTFCPQCNPYPGAHPVQQAPLPPARRGMFTAGAVGSLLVAIMAILIGIFTLILVLEYDDLDNDIMALLAITTIIFLIGSIIMSIGFLGFSRSYGSHMGVVALIFGIIAPILLFFFTVISYEYSYYSGYYYYNSYSYYYLNIFALWLGHIMIGVMLILMGVSSLLVGKHTGRRGTSIAAGTLLIVSGGMCIGLLGFIGVAWFLLSAAAFVQAALFLRAPGRSQNNPPQQQPAPYGYAPPPPPMY